jgi:hypothetical protein
MAEMQTDMHLAHHCALHVLCALSSLCLVACDWSLLFECDMV